MRFRHLRAEQLENRRLLNADGGGHALYVWRAPGRDGTAVDQLEAVEIAQFARSESLETILYDGFGDGSCGNDSGLQFETTTPNACTGIGDDQMGAIIEIFRQYGLEVEALYTDATRILDVVAYNTARVPANRQFDGIRLNIESSSFPGGTWPGGGNEPTAAVDIQIYRDAVTAAAGIPVYASIGHHWGTDAGELPILFDGQTKPAYEHIIDETAGIDVQTAQDQAAVIINITADEVSYAHSQNKRVQITIETYDVVTNEGLNSSNTFFEEGSALMKSELADISYPALAHPNFAFHFYKQSFGSTNLTGWERSISSAAYNVLNERTSANQGGFFVYQDADSAFNHGIPVPFPAGADVNFTCLNDRTSADGCSSDPNALDRERGTVLQIVHNPANAVIVSVPFIGTAGYNLESATELVFEARSPTPGGVGVIVLVDGAFTSLHVPESDDFVTLSAAIPADLSDVSSLFRIDISQSEPGIVLLDNIRFEPIPDRQETEFSLPLGNETFGSKIASTAPFPPDQAVRNLATVYESSLTLLSLLERGTPRDLTDARQIADTFLYALDHDVADGNRIPIASDGSHGLHSGYQGGDVAAAPGSSGGGPIRLPGFFTGGQFFLLQDGATGGNNAFAVLAFLAAYRQFGDVAYLDGAREISRWIVDRLQDDTGTGFGGYYLGFADGGGPAVGERPLLLGKSTENNADIYAAFSQLSAIERALGIDADAALWQQQANHAGDFVMAMFEAGDPGDATDGRFSAGTLPDGIAPGPGVVPSTDPSHIRGNDVINLADFLDSISFAVLALARSPRFHDQIDWREPVRYMLGAFDVLDGQGIMANGQTFQGFSIVDPPEPDQFRLGNPSPDGIAWEFTGQAIATMRFVDRLYGTSEFEPQAAQFLSEIERAQHLAPFGNGAGLVGSTLDGENDSTSPFSPTDQCLTTPFQCIPERVGLAATNWAIYAEQDVNIFDPQLATSESLTVSITDARIVENGGSRATTATVTRHNTDVSAELIVSLTNGDDTEISIPATVTIPATQSSVSFDISAVDDNLLDGTQTVTITASASGYESSDASLDVLDHEALSISITAASIFENDGTRATTATATRSNLDDLSQSLTVTLTNGDDTEISIPATVTIPATQSSVGFDIGAVDDNLLDGTQTVTITASVTGYFGDDASLDVLDYETLSISIASAAIFENDDVQATAATITRSNLDDLSQPVSVTLTNGDDTEILIPATVTIPANQASASFDLDAVDDDLLDGTQTVTITASATGYFGDDALLDVLDHEALSISITAAAIFENDDVQATTATVTRSNVDDLSQSLTVTLTNGDDTEILIPVTVTIPANQASASFDVDAVDDDLLDGTQTVTITASATGYFGDDASLDVLDNDTLSIRIAVATIFENDGAQATTATVTRSNLDDLSQSLTVTLTNGDDTEITIPATVTIPANQASASFDVGAVDDNLLDGTQTVAITASATGYFGDDALLDVLDYETLSISIASVAIFENDGAQATTATVTRSNLDDLSQSLTVTLTNGDDTEITIPATVTIPANQASASFDVDAVDDDLLDGTQTVAITASATGYFGDDALLDVLDHETLSINITAVAIFENDGVQATTATVTRSNLDDLSQSLSVTLTNGDDTEITIPATVTIPANQASASFDLDAVDDDLLDDTQTVTITASATGYFGDDALLDVLDHETLSISITAAAIFENDGTQATAATVTRSNLDDLSQSLTVTLTNGDDTEITIPATVTIPANQASASFDVDAVDDDLLDGTQTVTITASATGYFGDDASLDVLDNDTLSIRIAVATIFENDGAQATTATVTRSNLDDLSQSLTVTLTNGDDTEITIPATVTIPANQASASFDVDAVDDNLLDGTQTVTITASATGYNPGADSLDVLDHETLSVSIAAVSIFENDGTQATAATITRSNLDNLSQPVSVALTNGDDTDTEITIPATVTIPANQASASFDVDAVDDDLLDGTQTVTITASATGCFGDDALLDVLDHEALSISITAAAIFENDDVQATTATVTRSNVDDLSQSLTVTLTNGDDTEILIPVTVTIPANQASASFDVDAVDDNLLDGTQTVTIEAAHNVYVGGADSLDVTDYETLTVSILAQSVTENRGRTTATVTRSNSDVSLPLTVILQSDDLTEATVPVKVEIGAGDAFASFPVTTVDDNLLDGTQVVVVTAIATGYVKGASSVDVADHETLMITVNQPSISENGGSTTATVARSSIDDLGLPLVVTLASNDLTEATVSSSVTIPANEAAATFLITAVDDDLLDGVQQATITASSIGYSTDFRGWKEISCPFRF